MNFFSIIIPLYNRPAEIRELLDSLTQQTYKHFEVVVVEDGSTEKSEEIVASFRDRLEVKYFFKENSGKISMEYNAISGKLVLTDGESQKEYQRDLPGFDSYGVYDISEEDIQRVKDSLDSVSSKNKEVSMKVMLKVRGERQMCDLKLHTLWSSIKTDGYIGIVGQLDIVK